MEFIKYNSIENHYQTKFIGRFLESHPKLYEDEFVVLEKLDGANIQFCINPNGEWKVGKRTEWIDLETEKFNDIQRLIKVYDKEIGGLKELAKISKEPIRVYGELYGQGIQRRINYGDDKYISFFDLRVGHDFVSHYDFERSLSLVGLSHLAPKVFFKGKLTECLDYDVENKNIEGVVIKPYNDNHYSPVGARLIIKKKSEKFNDTAKVKKPKSPGHPLNIKFRSYITENRVKDVFSKYGEIDKPQQIPDYIKYVLDDAKEDFRKNVDIDKECPCLDKEEEKKLYNVGSDIVKILKKYL